MPELNSSRIALFIDGANIYATAKALGFDIDYKRLLKEFQSRGTLVRAYYYTAIIEDQEYLSIRPLIDWLDYNSYTVVTKAAKEFTDASGRRRAFPLAGSKQTAMILMMHQTILAMLGLATCALILVAFWGSDLLGNKWRGQR